MPPAGTATATVLTLENVLDIILADTSLASPRRQDMASALRTLGKVLGQPLREVPVHAPALRALLAASSPGAVGLSAGRWANVRSLVRKAFALADVGKAPRPQPTPLTPAWKTLMSGFVGRENNHMRLGLSRLARFASGHGVDPAQVNDKLLTALLTYLSADALHKNPRRSHRMACQAWNRAVELTPGLAGAQVAVPDYRRTYVLAPADLPGTLVADIEAFLTRMAGETSWTEDDDVFHPLRPRSIATRRQQLMGFVSALIRSDVPATSLRTLADVITPELVKTGLRFIIEHANATAGGTDPKAGWKHAYYTGRALVAVAKYWVKPDRTDPGMVQHHQEKIGSLMRLLAKRKPRKTGLSARNRTVLRHFDDQGLVDRYLTLPDALVTSLRGVNDITRDHALTYQLAIVIDLLQMLPIRLTNLAQLSIGRNLIRMRSGQWQIALSAEETKNGHPIDALLPLCTGHKLDAYLETWRPVLLAGRLSNWLLPGRAANSHKSADQLRAMICNGTRRHLGLRLNPHVFRHVAAKLYLDSHPGAYGVVKHTLGHRSMDTTIENYCGAEGVQAIAAFDSFILQRRQEAAASPPPSRPMRKSIARTVLPAMVAE
jgi:hypothetical protein